jgi:hypothetical protein
MTTGPKVNHEQARRLAERRKGQSNLARAYLELHRKAIGDYQHPCDRCHAVVELKELTMGICEKCLKK